MRSEDELHCQLDGAPSLLLGYVAERGRVEQARRSAEAQSGGGVAERPQRVVQEVVGGGAELQLHLTTILLGESSTDVEFLQSGNAMDYWYLGSPQVFCFSTYSNVEWVGGG